MAQDWLADVKKYVPDCDETVVAGIVRYCGIALRNRDSSLVSFSDDTEVGRVRNNFLKKKLGRTETDEELNAEIAKVGDVMKGESFRNRVTVYYLLTEIFGAHELFGGKAGTKSALFGGAGAGLAAGAAGLAGAAAAGASTLGEKAGEVAADIGDAASAAGSAAVEAASTAVETVGDGLSGAAAAVGAAGAAGVATLAGLAGGSGHADTSSGGHGSHGGGTSYSDASEGGSGFGKWWPLLLLALALLALFFLLRSCKNEPAVVPVDNALNGVAINVSANDSLNAAGNVAANTAAIVEPEGSAVIALERNGLPALNVYFDSGKADVAAEFEAKAAAVKAYVEAHPGTKLTVSGFNDPTGNAALNAELSKNRAQNVGAALEKLGIAKDAVSLEKPADTTISSTDKASARRVEVTIKQ